MKVIKKINNNVAIGLTKDNHEVVIFGKGIGFGQMPYELTDLSKIQRTFYNIDSRYYGLLNEIPEKIFLIVTQLLDIAKRKIDGNWNPNVVFILADHIHFAVERNRKGICIPLPYSYELEYEHPELTEIAEWFIERINKELNVSLGGDEITCITIHLLNALERYDVQVEQKYSPQQIALVIKDITKIIEAFFKIEIDQKSFYYFRFKNHLKLFMQRKEREYQFSNQKKELYESIKNTYPDVFKCVTLIEDYFLQEFSEQCPQEERLFLMVHVIQLFNKEDCNRKGINSKR